MAQMKKGHIPKKQFQRPGISLDKVTKGWGPRRAEQIEPGDIIAGKGSVVRMTRVSDSTILRMDFLSGHHETVQQGHVYEMVFHRTDA